VLASTSDAAKGGIREAADLVATAVASAGRVGTRRTQSDARIAGDITRHRLAPDRRAIDVSRAAGRRAFAPRARFSGDSSSGARVGNVRAFGSAHPVRLVARPAAVAGGARSRGHGVVAR